MTDLTARLGLPTDRPARILALGAHPDDIEIGAAGTIMRLLAERPDCQVQWVVLSGAGDRIDEARRSAEVLAGGAGSLEVRILTGRDGFLPYQDAVATKESVAAVAQPAPDLVLVHRHDDAHQDHRFAAELAWQTFRWSTILEYEIPKWDGDLGTTNVYVGLAPDVVERKVAHLMAAFPSQLGRDWYTPDTFHAILRLRGIESRSPGGMAEAFLARKLTV